LDPQARKLSGVAKLTRAVPLATQVETALAARLTGGEFSAGDRFPTEHELAEDMGVSRATVRSAVGSLARRGLLVSQQGRGSFVTAAASALSHTLTEATDLGEVLGRNGARVSIRFDSAALEAASPEVQAALGLAPTDLVLRTAKTFLADTVAMIYIQCAIPLRILGAELAEGCVASPERTEPLFDFLSTHTNAATEYQLSDLAAVPGSQVVYPGKPVGRTVAVLQITETGYTADNTPIWWSRNWYPPSDMQFTLVRRRPRGTN
jgi:GntR family transcriptional regulator